MKTIKSCRSWQCGGFILTILLAAAGAVHANNLFTLRPIANGNPLADGPYTIGNTFTVGPQALIVTQLGAMDTTNGAPWYATNGFIGGASSQVGLWTGDGLTLLGSVTVASSDPVNGNYRYHSLTTPITLAAGSTNMIGVLCGVGYEYRLDTLNTGPMAIPDSAITVIGSGHHQGSTLSPLTTSDGSGANSGGSLRWVQANASFSVVPTVASTNYWDQNGNTAGLGGTGAWDTTSSFWTPDVTGSSGSMVYPNTNGILADFAGTAGTATIASGTAMVVDTIQFDTTGYTIAGADSTATLSNAVLTVTTGAGNSEAINAVIAGATTLWKNNDSGTLTLGGVNTYTGNTVIQGGTLTIGGTGQLGGGTYAGAINNAGTLVYNGSAPQTFSGAFWNSGAYVNNSPAAQTFSGAFANSGAFVYNSSAALTFSGTFWNNSAFVYNSSATLTVSGTFWNNGAYVNNSPAAQTFSGSFSGIGPVTNLGSGELILSGVGKNYTGATTISAGTLLLTNVANTFNSSIYVAPGAFLELGATNTAVDTMCVGGTASTTQITGTGTINKTGLGWVEGTKNEFLNFNGTININAGIFGSGFANGLIGTAGSTMIINVASGSWFDLRGAGVNAAKIDQLTGSGDVGTTHSVASTLTVGTANGSSTFSGIIRGAGGGPTITSLDAQKVSLVKVGTGTFATLGANTYAGTTTVSNGKLLVNSPGSLAAASAVTVQNGGTLSGNGVIGGAVTVQSGGILAPGNNNLDMLTISGALTFNAGSTNIMLINKQAGPVLTSSLLTGMAGVTYGGTLKVTATGAPLAIGDTFTLFTLGSGSYAGLFTTLNLPALTGSLRWDTSGLLVNGSIMVSAGASVPLFNPVAGGYASPQSVTISSDAGSRIFYTTDGSTPTAASPSGFSPLVVALPANSSSYTLSAYATNSGVQNSAVGVAAYSTTPVPTWMAPAGGNWSTSADWSNNVVANRSGVTANFSALTLPGDLNVTLDSSSTVGNMIFGDIGNTYNSYIQTNGGSSSLALDAGATVPTVMVNNQSATINPAVTGTNGLTKLASGTLTLGGGPGITYTGPTTVSNGLLSIVGGLNFASTPVMVNPGATLNFYMDGAPSMTGIPHGKSIAAFMAVSLNGSAGVITINGTGYFIFGEGGDVRVNMASGGMFDVQSGDVQFGWSAHAFDANLGGLNLAAGASLHNSQPTMQFDALTGGGNIGNAFNAATVLLTLGVNNTLNNATYGVSNNTATFDGAILDHEHYNGQTTTTLNVIKTGTGTQIFDGPNTYSGYTKINGGTLLVNSPGSLGSGAITVANGATLGGDGVIGGAVMVQSGGTLAPGNNSLGTLYISGALTLTAGSTNLMRIDKQAGPVLTSSLLTGMAGVTYNGTLKVTATGDPLQAGDTFTLFSLGSGSYAGQFTTFNLPALPVGLTWDKSSLTVNGSISVVPGTGTPLFNPVAGGYQSPQSVTISSDAGSRIYYTTDGSTPTPASPSGISPVVLALPANTTGITLSAYATNSGVPASAVAVATYWTTPVPTWIEPNGGTWSTGASWSNNVMADHSGWTADFSTLTLPADTSVYLDTPATVGYLVFGDLGNAYNWILADGGAGPLTLDAASNMPVITVVNTNTTISATLAGTGGLLKAGAGTLTLSSDNIYTGGTVVNAGTLNLTGTADINSKVGPGTLTVNTNGLVTLGASGMLGNLGTIGYTPSVVVNHGTIDCSTHTLAFRDLTMTGGTLSGDTTAGIWNSYGNVTINANAAGASIGGSELVLQNPYPPIEQTFNVAAGGSGSDLTITATLIRNGGGGYTGTYTNVVKTGNGIMTLMAANNSLVGNTLLVSNGTLVVNGSLTASTPVYVAPAGTLAGNGGVGGPVVNDGTLAPGTNGIGTLTVSNLLTLNAGSTTTLAINRTAGTGTYGNVQGITSASLGGTLTVTSLGGTFQNGDTFTLFSAGISTGDFAVKNLPALASGLAWQWTPASGTLQVVSGSLTPPTLSGFGPTAGGFALTFSGPSGQTYKVLSSTNVALPLTNWTVLASGTFGASPVNYTNTPANAPQRFYRVESP